MNESYIRRRLDGERASTGEILQGSSSMRAVTRVISFTSGKGGVGKTHCVCNVGTALVNQGRSVLVLDADLGLANVDVLLGIRPKSDIRDVISGDCELSDVIVHSREGLAIIPAASGVDSLVNLDFSHKLPLIEAIEALAPRYDYLLIDTPAGIGADVLHFNSASADIVCVITGEPTSLTDAYALIKVMSQRFQERNFSILVNNVANEGEARKAFRRLETALERFLSVRVNYLGWVPADEHVGMAAREQRAVVDIYPSSPAARAFTNLGDKIDEELGRHRLKGGMQFFFRQLIECPVYGN